MTPRSHRLSAIWFADIVDYTGLSSRDEYAAMRLVELLQAAARAAADRHDGRIVKFLGDAVLAEFPSTDSAVRAALRMQQDFAARVAAAGMREHALRVGVHVGDIVKSSDGDVYGDGVNVASRVQGLTEPGEVWVSEDVWRQLRQRPGFHFEPQGERELKGLVAPMTVYGVRMEEGAAVDSPEPAPAGASGTEMMPQAKAAAPPRSIAVLPFANMSRDPDNEYFSDGITETLLMTLTKLGDLKVISRTSVMQYKATTKSVRQIGEELDVATVLEGSVQRAGQRVRITAQLIEARTDAHLWAETYDRNLDDIFAIQSEVAEQIATSLKSALTPAEKARIDSRPTDTVEAYQQFLKGRYFLARRTPQALRQASDLFEEAVREDPAFALAWSGLADANMLLKTYNPTPVPEALPKGKAAAQRALALDPGLGEVHASLAVVAAHEWNWEEAEREHRRAIELSPGYATAYHWYGNLLSFRGRHDEAISMLRRALDLDPLSLPVHMGLGVAYLFAGQRERAQELYEKALGMDPGYVPAITNMAVLHLQCGRFEEALDAMKLEAELEPDPFRAGLVDEIRAAYRARGPEGFWESTMKALRSEAAGSKRDRYGLAQAYVQLGRTEDALTVLDWMVTERDAGLVQVPRDILFEPLWSDSRFKALMRRVGLE